MIETFQMHEIIGGSLIGHTASLARFQAADRARRLQLNARFNLAFQRENSTASRNDGINR